VKFKKIYIMLYVLLEYTVHLILSDYFIFLQISYIHTYQVLNMKLHTLEVTSMGHYSSPC